MKNKINQLLIISTLFITFSCNDNTLSSVVKNVQSDVTDVKSQNVQNVNSQIDVKTGEEFVIVVDADRSSGYKWDIDSSTVEKNYAKFISSKYEPANSETGSSAKFICVFKALNKGNTSINLKYSKVSDKSLEKIQSFDLNITEPINNSKLNFKFLTDIKKRIFG